ncbi:MAG TPA: hypothetical protein DCZ71_08025 [Ruminococcus sp.]|nr:hypothetical protein [Ruminococcus sp.]
MTFIDFAQKSCYYIYIIQPSTKEELSMKKSLLISAISCAVLLTSCGSPDNASKAAEPAITGDSPAVEYKDDYENYDSENNAMADEAPAEAGDNSAPDNKELKQSRAGAIDTQMLVYSCDMSIDVLEFDDSVSDLHKYINMHKGFLESENYSDGGSSGKWQYADDQKWKSLTAVIRVPSSEYEEFCNDLAGIGDLRRKNANVENLSTEYSDLKTTLSIYEAKEQRYLDILAEIKDQSEALSVENELTDIQIEIAKLKTRMNDIENDVAYSHIYLTMNEVREYQQTPTEVQTDTFGQRLGNTVNKTWNGFLSFMEGLLFVLISILPYALVAGIVVLIIMGIRKKLHPRVEKKKKEFIDKVTSDKPDSDKK